MTADVTVARAHHSCPNTTTTLAAIRAASTGPRNVAARTGASPCAAATTGETATAATAGTIVGIFGALFVLCFYSVISIYFGLGASLVYTRLLTLDGCSDGGQPEAD